MAENYYICNDKARFLEILPKETYRIYFNRYETSAKYLPYTLRQAMEWPGAICLRPHSTNQRRRQQILHRSGDPKPSENHRALPLARSAGVDIAPQEPERPRLVAAPRAPDKARQQHTACAQHEGRRHRRARLPHIGKPQQSRGAHQPQRGEAQDQFLVSPHTARHRPHHILVENIV